MVFLGSIQVGFMVVDYGFVGFLPSTIERSETESRRTKPLRIENQKHHKFDKNHLKQVQVVDELQDQKRSDSTS